MAKMLLITSCGQCFFRGEWGGCDYCYHPKVPQTDGYTALLLTNNILNTINKYCHLEDAPTEEQEDG